MISSSKRMVSSQYSYYLGFRGDEKINKQISRESGRKSQKSQLDYSDEEELDHYENAKKYEKDKLRLDDQGKTNMVINDLLQDLKLKVSFYSCLFHMTFAVLYCQSNTS